MDSLLSLLKPNVRLYDKQRGRERLIQSVETQGNVLFLTLRDAKTGEAERRPFVTSTIADRFDVLYGSDGAFQADPQLLRLVAEAHRLNHAYLFNPVFATETSLIDPLPHQLVAVYGLPPDADYAEGVSGLLTHPRLRFLLADDAGAGKTIMAGLYVREMLLRRLIRRVLIIPPAGLVGNWERELRNLFRLRFRIVDSGDVKPDFNPFTDSRYELAILSVDTARQERVRQALNEATPYDLVICDEAHKLSARRNPDLTVDRSKRYETIEEVAARCQHLLLLTATPHMGKDDPYFFLWRLLDPKQFSTPDALYRSAPRVRRRHLLRRMKEEMVTFAGADLYPPRSSKTVSYPLNADERLLYEAVSQYVEEYYRKTTSGNRSSVGLALAVIQRRLASSTWALLRSLERREQRIADYIVRIEQGLLSASEYGAEQERLPTTDLREEKTGDEEEMEDGEEEAERFDEAVSGATSSRSLADLTKELEDVRALVTLARGVYDKQNESKFERLAELLKEHPDTKILIFTEHRDTLNFLVARMEAMGHTDRIATIHGGMDYRERERQADRFRSAECPYLIATDAAGEGINLQFCWLLINYDIPWNPARLEQRMGRVHRYKQTHDVLLLSLVAEQTREGSVLQTLLDKLEIIRQRLGSDKVFDVIGDQLGGVSLSDLLFRATVQGDESAAEELSKSLDPDKAAARLASQQARVEVSEVRVLLDALRRGQETAEERRMMPAYVRLWFAEAAARIGIQLEGSIDELFELKDPPETVNRALERYPQEIQSRLTFERERALPKMAATPEAVYLHPGEPVFEAVMDLFLGRHENEVERGATFYDPNTTEPYLFLLAKIAVVRPRIDRDGMVTDERETLGEEMTGIRLGADGALQAVPAHLLLTLDIDGPPNAQGDTLPDLPATLREGVNDTAPVEAFLLSDRGVPLFDRLKSELQSRFPERRTQLVQAYNLRSAESMGQRRRLKDDVERGVPAARSKLDRLEAEIAALDDARDAAIAALQQEIDLLDFSPVTIYARALVLPLPPEEAQRRRDVQAEAVAVKMARAYEEALGAAVEDVSAPNLAMGYDLRSHRPNGEVLYIEVKGRAGINPVQMTENEWRQAVNHPDRYWLYTVYHCETATPQLYRVANPFGKLIATSNGVVISPAELLSAADL